MEFKPGDMQFLHNHTLLHDRTAYVDWDEPEKKRHLLRLWLAAPNGRELPAVYAERYGTITIGDRGGIICDGTRLNAPLDAVCAARRNRHGTRRRPRPVHVRRPVAHRRSPPHEHIARKSVGWGKRV